MPAPYKTVEELIVNAMLLGSAFSIQSGLQQLRNWDNLFAKTIIEYNFSLTNPKGSGLMA